MSLYNLSPVILFAYDRPLKLRESLESLSDNVHAGKTHLYINIDGVKPSSLSATVHRNQEVVNIAQNYKWPGTKEVLLNNKNHGVAKSITDNVSKLIAKHKKLIVLEDDIIASRYFLKFMNDALDIYRNKNKVFGISGYCPPYTGNIPDTYFLPTVNSWGWATWERAWRHYNNDARYLLNQLTQKNLIDRFNFGASNKIKMLEDQIENKIDSWAICFLASMILQEGLFLYPNKSLVQNIGFDAEGTHTNNNSSIHSKRASNDSVNVSVKKPEFNPREVRPLIKSIEKRTVHHEKYRLRNGLNRFIGMIKKVVFWDGGN